MAITRSKRLDGFSIIELLIVVVIIGLLATIVTLNVLDTRARARDANRKGSVDAYSTAMEQWRTMSKHKSYFVYASEEGTACNASRAESMGDGFMFGDLLNPNCVGYKGGGGGRLTRKSSANGLAYGSKSIAEALRDSGVLTTIRPDPNDGGAFDTKESGNDFILTLCDKTGHSATSPSKALDFAIYASLERPEDSNSPSSHTEQAKHTCGGPDSGHGWDLLDSWD